jgi:hypothetical protein
MWSHMRMMIMFEDEERLVSVMVWERPQSMMVAAGGDIIMVGDSGAGGSDGDLSRPLQEINTDDSRKDSSVDGGGTLGASTTAAVRSRSWVAPHMGYMSWRYAPPFHSFAWVHVVQNKPLVPAADTVGNKVDHVMDISEEEMKEGGKQRRARESSQR